jgi:hypothetical protein
MFKVLFIFVITASFAQAQVQAQTTTPAGVQSSIGVSKTSALSPKIMGTAAAPIPECDGTQHSLNDICYDNEHQKIEVLRAIRVEIRSATAPQIYYDFGQPTNIEMRNGLPNDPQLYDAKTKRLAQTLPPCLGKGSNDDDENCVDHGIIAEKSERGGFITKSFKLKPVGHSQVMILAQMNEINKIQAACDKFPDYLSDLEDKIKDLRESAPESETKSQIEKLSKGIVTQCTIHSLDDVSHQNWNLAGENCLTEATESCITLEQNASDDLDKLTGRNKTVTGDNSKSSQQSLKNSQHCASCFINTQAPPPVSDHADIAH